MLFICPSKVIPSLLETPCLYKSSLLFSRNSSPAGFPALSEPFLLPFLHVRPGLHMFLIAEPLGGQQEQLCASWPQSQHCERILFSKSSDTQFQYLTTQQVCHIVTFSMSFSESGLFLVLGSQTAAFFLPLPPPPTETWIWSLPPR